MNAPHDAPINPVGRRAQAKARTRDKVLVAARALFNEVGYAAATIRDIAVGAGMSTGAVFANFDDKAALYRAAMNAPVPSLDLPDEIARVRSRLPGWAWLLRWNGAEHLVALTRPQGGPNDVVTGRGPTEADAMRDARLRAERKREGDH